MPPSTSSVHILVIGDLNRSPRMLRHALAFAQSGWRVTLAGTKRLTVDDVSTRKAEQRGEALRFASFVQPPSWLKSIRPRMVGFLLQVGVKEFFYKKFQFLLSALILLTHLVLHCRARLVLLQNPPALPSFLVTWFFCKVTGKCLFIDWHNFGYTIVQLETGVNSLSSRLYKLLELDFASRFLRNDRPGSRYGHLCVSKAMRETLKSYNLNAVCFYDRPPDEAKRVSIDESHRLLERLALKWPDQLGDRDKPDWTRLTQPADASSSGEPAFQWRHNRPTLVVSSCSYTQDDNLDLLLHALDLVDRRLAVVHDDEGDDGRHHQSKLLVALTGRGPLQSHFELQIVDRNWTHVEVFMPWLDWADYLPFIGLADAGISLHSSSSGLDLPMKVVDLIGVEVPVLALSYPVLDELLVPKGHQTGAIGFQFNDSCQLANLLLKLIASSPRQSNDPQAASPFDQARDQLRLYNQREARGYRYWRSTTLPIVNQLLEQEENS